MDAEILQICNTLPKNSIELSLIIELLDERYKEEEIESLLKIINDTFN